MTTISVRSVDDLIALVPHLLGHQPADALVLVNLRGNALLFAARIPLVDDGGSPCPDQALEDMVESAVDAVVRNGADAVFVIAFESASGQSGTALGLLTHHAGRVGLTLRDLAVVRHGRRWSPWSPDVRARVDGKQLAPAPDSPAVLAHVLRGSAPLEDRHAVRALVAEDETRAPGVLTALDDVLARATVPNRRPGRAGRGRGAELSPATLGRRQVPRQGRLWAALLAGERRAVELTDQEVASMLLSLVDRDWRDALIACTAPGSLPIAALRPETRRAAARWLRGSVDPARAIGPTERRVHLDRLMGLARLAPDAHPASASMLAVVGCVAWHLGLGSVAGDAHSRALAIDPGHRLAMLGMRLVTLAVCPPGVASRRPPTGPEVEGPARRAV